MNESEGSRLRLGLLAVLVCIGLAATAVASGQSLPTATRLADTQIGGMFLFAKSTNSQVIPSTGLTLPGYGIYGVFDKREHLGIEGGFRQVNDMGGSQIYERTYEVGPRYVLHYDRYIFNPYGKLLYGRGVYNYPHAVANLAYNMYTVGAGADVRLSYSFNVRVDYEYQTWMGFPRGDIHPGILGVGVAYHFPQDCRTHICPKD